MARQNRANNFGDGPAVARLGAKNECLFSAGRFGATHVPQMCPIKVNGERRIPTEWDVVIGNSHDLRGGDVRVDVSPLLGREAEVDDRRVSHFLDFRDRAGSDGARACHGRFDLGEVPDARNILPHNLRARRDRHQAAGDVHRRKP